MSTGGASVDPIGSVTVRFSREVVGHSGSRSRRRGGPTATEKDPNPDPESVVAEVFALETVRELCERCLVNPFNNGPASPK